MKKIQFLFLAACCILAGCATNRTSKAEAELQQARKDVRQLLNDIDNYGDIDTYTGSDHFERLYKWSHNIK